MFLFPPSICPQQSSRDPWQRGHSGHWAAPGCHFPVPTLLPPPADGLLAQLPELGVLGGEVELQGAGVRMSLSEQDTRGVRGGILMCFYPSSHILPFFYYFLNFH